MTEKPEANNKFTTGDSSFSDRPLDVWSEQRKFVLRLSGPDLKKWLEFLFERKPFPLILGETEPCVFALHIFGSAPMDFQQKVRDAITELVQSYHPAHHSLHYLGNLIHVCTQVRIPAAHDVFMKLIYTRAFEMRYSSDYQEASGEDLQANLIAGAAALRPHDDRRIVLWCQRMLDDDYPVQYAELAFQVLWELDPDDANRYFGKLVQRLTGLPKVERLGVISRQCRQISERYGEGKIFLGEEVDRLLESCREKPPGSKVLRRSRLSLYATLLDFRSEDIRKRCEEDIQAPDTRSDGTYPLIRRVLTNRLRDYYGLSSLKQIYGLSTIDDAIDLYQAEVTWISELRKNIQNDPGLYHTELKLIELAVVGIRERKKLGIRRCQDLPDLFEPAITRNQVFGKTAI